MGLCGEDIALEMRLFTLSPSVTFRPPQSAKRSLPIKEFHGIEACRKRLGLILTIASAGIKLSISAYIASFFSTISAIIPIFAAAIISALSCTFSDKSKRVQWSGHRQRAIYSHAQNKTRYCRYRYDQTGRYAFRSESCRVGYMVERLFSAIGRPDKIHVIRPQDSGIT